MKITFLLSLSIFLSVTGCGREQPKGGRENQARARPVREPDVVEPHQYLMALVFTGYRLRQLGITLATEDDSGMEKSNRATLDRAAEGELREIQKLCEGFSMFADQYLATPDTPGFAYQDSRQKIVAQRGAAVRLLTLANKILGERKRPESASPPVTE